MKTVIVYYSFSGNNESLAKELRLRFGCDIIKIIEQKRRTGFTILLDLIFNRESKILEPDIFLDEYKSIIFIAPIWNSKIATPLVSYIKKERANINSYAFITVCGGHEGQKEKIEEQLYAITHKKPIVVTELALNELLSKDQKDKVRLATPYRIKNDDFTAFKKPIQNFVNAIFSYSIERQPELKVY